MAKSISCYELGIEVGRKCPCHCDMCLRGNEEDETISVDTVKKFLKEFSYIRNITFTGGEPTLYESQIIEIVDYIIENNIAVGGFYVATSGLFKVPKLMLKLAEFYAYISLSFCDENYSAFELSNDIFHPPVPLENKTFFKSFSFYSERRWADENSGWIAEGRALEADIKKCFGVDYNKSFEVAEEYDESVTYEKIYLNALGCVLPDCNYSYESQRKMEPFAYGSMPLGEILKTYNQTNDAIEGVA